MVLVSNPDQNLILLLFGIYIDQSFRDKKASNLIIFLIVVPPKDDWLLDL